LNVDAAIKVSQAAIGKTVGDYTLVNTAGQPVRLSSYRGKPLLVNFIYTGCFQVCPTATRTLKRSVEAAQGVLGPDAFRAVSIGFNLPFDTPEALRAFARQQAADLRGWDFLSPEAASLDALTRDFGFTYKPSPRGFDHVLQITVVDAEGRFYRQIYGDDFAVPQVVGPLRELITGARRENESLSGFFDRVRILCTVYDPASGKYRIKYSIFFELAGGLLGLIAMAWYFLRELRRSRAA
jgi:protein SCO1/2